MPSKNFCFFFFFLTCHLLENVCFLSTMASPTELPAACFTSPSRPCPSPPTWAALQLVSETPSVIRLLRTFNSAGHLQATGNGTQTSACSSPLAECGARSLRRVLGHGQGVSGKGISFSLPSVPPLCTPCATGSRFLSPSCPTLMIDSLFPWPLPPWPRALYPSPLTPCPKAMLV